MDSHLMLLKMCIKNLNFPKQLRFKFEELRSANKFFAFNIDSHIIS